MSCKQKLSHLKNGDELLNHVTAKEKQVNPSFEEEQSCSDSEQAGLDPTVIETAPGIVIGERSRTEPLSQIHMSRTKGCMGKLM